MTEEKINVPEGQGVPKEVKDLIEGGKFVKIPKEQVVGFITIAFVKENPEPRTRLRYEYQGIPALSLPMLLKKVAKDIEDEIIRGVGGI